VFDPLALALLLASQYSFQRFRNQVNDQPTTIPLASPIPDLSTTSVDEPASESNKNSVSSDQPALKEKTIFEQHPYLNQPFGHFKHLEPMVYKPELEQMNDRSAILPLEELKEANSLSDDEAQNMLVYAGILNKDGTLTKDHNESPVVRPGDYLIPNKEGGLFVQNEEQQESNLWTSTINNNTITPEEYIKVLHAKMSVEPQVSKLVSLVRTGRMTINDVPEDLRKEVSTRL
jgi:hypothetical protein